MLHKYSDFFRTLHDERTQTGNLGRGTHYSVLRAVVFGDAIGRPLGDAQFADFAVIWDEDHDERVIEAVEKVYFAGLLSHFLMFGERKGVFTAISANGIANDLEAKLSEITQHLDNGDCWPAKIAAIDQPHNPIISAADEKVTLYLKNLMMLWELGIKPREGQDQPIS